jgi:hypothetical protein
MHRRVRTGLNAFATETFLSQALARRAGRRLAARHRP